MFYGVAPCGYAAAAFSMAAPGATVVALQPQATLDPQLAEWDGRFVKMRHVSFTDRYCFAPDMLDAAEKAFVLCDPEEPMDAMHAALFHRSNVARIRMRCMPGNLESHMHRMGMISRLLTSAAEDRLTPQAFHQMHRARRHYRAYLLHLMNRCDAKNQSIRTMLLCGNITRRMTTRIFRKRLAALRQEVANGTLTLPKWWPDQETSNATDGDGDT